MTDTGEMLVEMWLALKPYVDKKERADAVLAFLRAAESFIDMEAAREEAKGSDTAIDAAFAEILGEDEVEEEDDEDEDY
jgi:hypothetical protein